MVVLIHIFVMINGVEHLFISLSAICISSLKKYLFKSFTHCFVGLFGYFCYLVVVSYRLMFTAKAQSFSPQCKNYLFSEVEHT